MYSRLPTVCPSTQHRRFIAYTHCKASELGLEQFKNYRSIGRYLLHVNIFDGFA